MTLLVRTAADPTATLATLRSVIRQMDPNLPVYGLRTLAEHVRQRLDKERGASALLGAFGALALILAALGLYGVMAYAVAQRTREIGIRMALGAARRQVLRLVVGEGLRLAGTGIGIGLVLAVGLTQVIRKFLFGVTPTDIFTFVLVAVIMSVVAAAASLVPARRASRVDPMVSLRSE
jgi:putative ABC transport system permease protein